MTSQNSSHKDSTAVGKEDSLCTTSTMYVQDCSLVSSSNPKMQVFSPFHLSFLLSPQSPIWRYHLCTQHFNCLSEKQRLANFFSKEPDNKHFRLCKLQSLLQLFNSIWKLPQTVRKETGMAVFQKTLFIKTSSSWTWPMGCSFVNPRYIV